MCEREGEGEGKGQRVQTDLCESEALFFNLAYLKLEFLRLGFTFSKPSLRDTRSTWPDSTWNMTTSGDRNRALKAPFRGPKSSL